MFIWNFLLKISSLVVYGLILQKAISVCFRENGKADAKHILWWSLCLFFIAVMGVPGEYALSLGLMLPFIHILYDAIINGLILCAIYHGIGFTITLTKKDYSQVRKARRNLTLVWVILFFLYASYQLSLKVAFFYGYYAVRIIASVYYIGKIIYWFHITSKEAEMYQTRYRMIILKYACIVSALYPLSILPQSDTQSPRINLIIALLTGILFYLGYVMPKWLQHLFNRFVLNPHLLRQNLWLVGVISEYYNQIDPTDKALLEYTLRGFCQSLGIRTSNINLMVKASYLMDIDKLYSSSHLSACNAQAGQEDLPCIFPKGQKHNSTLKAPRHKPGGAETEVEISTHIAQEMLQFSNIAQILRHVKERWDGLGYPDELRGFLIPVESRILAIVDAYVRALHQKSNEEYALMQIKKEAGKKFDPHLVSKFDEFLKEQQKKKQKEGDNKTADLKGEVRSAVLQN